MQYASSKHRHTQLDWVSTGMASANSTRIQHVHVNGSTTADNTAIATRVDSQSSWE